MNHRPRAPRAVAFLLLSLVAAQAGPLSDSARAQGPDESRPAEPEPPGRADAEANWARVEEALAARSRVLPADRPSVVVETGHASTIHALAFSPDGKLLATASGDRSVAVWDVASRRQIRSLAGHEVFVTSVAVAPGGKLVAAGGNDGSVFVWDVASGRRVASFEAHFGSVDRLLFTSDGSSVATAGDGRRPDETTRESAYLRVFDALTGAERANHVTDPAVGAIAADPKRPRIAYASGKTVSVVALDLEEPTAEFALEEWVERLAFSPDGRRLAVGTMTGAIEIWAETDGAFARAAATKPEGGAVASLAFSHDGRELISSTTSGVDPDCAGCLLAVHDAADGAFLRSLADGRDLSGGVAVSPAPATVATSSGTPVDGTAALELWDASGSKPPASLRGASSPVNSLALTADGRTLVIGSGIANEPASGAVYVWDLAAGRERSRITALPGEVEAVAVSPDGRAIAAGGEVPKPAESDDWPKGFLRAWGADGAGPGREIPVPGSVLSLRFSPDGKTLAAGAADFDSNRSLLLWDAASGRVRIRIEGNDRVVSLAFADGGKTLLSGGIAPSVAVRSGATGRESRSIELDSEAAGCLAVSPDGSRLAVGSTFPGLIELRALPSGRHLRSFYGHLFAVRAVAFSPDGRTLASAGNEGAAILWDVATGAMRGVLAAHSHMVSSAAFTPDGKFLFTGSLDGSVRLWDVAGRRELASIYARPAGGWVVVAADGRFDASDVRAVTGAGWSVPGEPGLRPLDALGAERRRPGLLAELLGFAPPK